MRLINLTYNDPKRWEEVRRIAGADIPFFKSIRMGGSGSPQAILVAAPREASELMRETIERKTCNIEIRKNGFIIRFRSRLETMAMVCSMQEVEAILPSESSEKDGLDMAFHLKSGEQVMLHSNSFHASGWKQFLKKHFGQLM